MPTYFNLVSKLEEVREAAVAMFSLKYRLVIVIAHLAAAGFINPPSMSGETAGDYSADAVYTLGSSLNITWYTSCPTVGLGLWQDGVNHVQSFTCEVSYSETGSELY